MSFSHRNKFVKDGGSSLTRWILLLHVMIAFYSLSGVFSKLAANQVFVGLGFFVCYGAMIAILGIYAIGWQQIIKHVPLTTAYANRAAAVVWSIIWGAFIFREHISALQLLGCAIIVAGVALFALAGKDES